MADDRNQGVEGSESTDEADSEPYRMGELAARRMLESLSEALVELQRSVAEDEPAIFAPDGPVPVDFDAGIMTSSGLTSRIASIREVVAKVRTESSNVARIVSTWPELELGEQTAGGGRA